MKYTFLFIPMLFCATLQVKAQVITSNQQAELTMTQVLTNKAVEGGKTATLKLRTTETSVQSHDGVPVYKTVREVEYTIKETAKKITRKREVLNSNTERLSSASKLEEIYPDVTTALLSGVLSPKTVKKNENGFKMPYLVSTDQQQGDTRVYFDKLSLIQSQGKTTTDSVLGTQIRYDVITEQLQYGARSEQLYLDQLESVQSIVALTTTDKSGHSHRVEVKEDIVVK